MPNNEEDVQRILNAMHAERNDLDLAGYPRTVAECIRDQKYKRGVLSAVRAFARSKPWQGSHEERLTKFKTVVADLANVYGLDPIAVIFVAASSTNGEWRPMFRTIVLKGKLSVVTLLHEFAHALGRNERKACVWSINLFRRCFPRSYARLRHDGHMLREGDPEC